MVAAAACSCTPPEMWRSAVSRGSGSANTAAPLSTRRGEAAGGGMAPLEEGRDKVTARTGARGGGAICAIAAAAASSAGATAAASAGSYTGATAGWGAASHSM
jgi:hypothetical protein